MEVDLDTPFGPIAVGEHPNPIGFISTLDRRYAANKHVGWIYIVRNPAFREPLVKIGKSRRPPMERTAELGAATAVPERFQLVCFVHASDHHAAEKMVHRDLANYRKSASKEFFDVPLKTALAALDRAAAAYPILMRKRPPVALPQCFEPVILTCPRCGTRQQIRQLVITVIAKCAVCAESISG